MGLLTGKVVIVTGAGAGIGRCHALACAAAGARVAIVDPGGAVDGTGSGGAAEHVAAEIRANGGDALGFGASVTDEAACAEVVRAVVAKWGRLDVLVNNAGILRDRTFAKATRAEWDTVLDVHLDGTRNMTRAALDALSVRGGAIVNTTSISGLYGNFGQSNYGAAKAGIYGLSRVLAIELAKRGITVNCVAPIAKTRMTEALPDVRDDFRPEHISPIVVYLASDLGRGVTGRVFGVEGQRIHAFEVREGAGVVKPGEALWTPTEIHARIDDILRIEASPRPKDLVGKVYDGGTHRIDRAEFLAYAAATDDPNPAYQGSDGIAPPMYHVRPMMPLLDALAADPELALDRLRLVHGEHAMRFLRPLCHGDTLRMSARLTSLADKPSGRVATWALFGHVDGELALSGSTTYFIRAEKPKEKTADGPKKPTAEVVAPPPPVRTVEQRVAPDQAVRYAEASTDRNPIHLDPAVAKAAGLPGVILHGLCTMALAQRDLIREVCGEDPRRLRGLSVRFARPVVLDPSSGAGPTLDLDLWDAVDDGGVRAVAFVTRSGSHAVLVNGRAELG